jgi:neutral ceramidase
MSYKIGCGKADITVFVYGKGMMGYGMHPNVAKSVETPLSVRAFVLQDAQANNKVTMVVAEICFYTIALKDAVLKKLQSEHPELGYTNANLMLSAQHTHSAAGGYSHHILYNLTIPGFQPLVFNKIVEGTITAILQAENNLTDAKINLINGEFAPHLPVAFNRSMLAYNNNPDVKKLTNKENHLAIDRTMKLLRFDTPEGKPIGSINWFGVHTTSISNDNTRLCYDNKGYAAAYFEQDIQQQTNNQQFIAAFAQDVAGDVSPNYKWDKDKKWMRGKYKNDFKSAQYNGKLQCQKAKELFDAAPTATTINGNIDTELMFVDFSQVDIDRQFTNGVAGLHTAPAAQGLAFFMGTKEGPGMPAALAPFSKAALSAVKFYEKTAFKLFASRKIREDIDQKHRAHGVKHLFMESGIGKIWGTHQIKNLVVPGFADLSIKYFKELDKLGFTKRTPWVPRILPIQIAIVGQLAILGIAAEITTVAGQRLNQTVLSILKHKGVQQVIINTYCNGYHGYITTAEEYDKQQYEGGHTIFGRWTLAAYQTKFKQLALQMLKPANERQIPNLQPDIFTPEEIWYGFNEVMPQNQTVNS